MDSKTISKIGAEPSEKVVASSAAQVVSMFVVATVMWILSANNVNPDPQWVAGMTGVVGLLVSGAAAWVKRDALRDIGKSVVVGNVAKSELGTHPENDADNEENITRPGGEHTYVGSTAI